MIDSRYNGPPTSGNGGYTCGVVAARAPWAGLTEVTLRTPPPLGEPLTVDEVDTTVQVSTADGTLVAVARPAGEEGLTPVPPVDHAAAVAASRDYPGFAAHPFATCFVCGPDRPDADGLGIFPGRISGQRTAAPFTVPDEVSPELVWAALDCPGGWAAFDRIPGGVAVLGRMTARIDRPPRVDERCVVVATSDWHDGRKIGARSTLYTAAGELLAAARAVWIDTTA